MPGNENDTDQAIASSGLVETVDVVLTDAGSHVDTVATKLLEISAPQSGHPPLACTDLISAIAELVRPGTRTADIEIGRVYEGRVARLMEFGAFVTILPGRDGLVHISQISDDRVEHVSDKLKEGDVVRVKGLEGDRQGRIRLSMRNVDAA